MKQKIKEFSKKYLLGFIIGSILFGTLGVYAVTYFPGLNTTYDNSDSGMTSTNVQDALDELYNVCVPPKAGDQIIEDAGLEKDPYECRYFFTGGNPNNYITFNDEKAGWRIISVECDGRIKIMKDANMGNMVWDTQGSNNWFGASLGTYLNKTYYNNLNITSQNQIITSDFSIGEVTYNTKDLVDQIDDENSKLWHGNIALPTVSEYLRTNSNKQYCGTFRTNNANYSSCVSTGWMDTTSVSQWWTLSLVPTADRDHLKAYFVHSSGTINEHYVYHYSYAVRPALYLSSEVTLTGSGTQVDPYVVS